MASRRTTLGPIAVNNRRTSMGGTHAAVNSRTAKQRRSIAAPRVSSLPEDTSNMNNNVDPLALNTPVVAGGGGRKSNIGGLSNSNSDSRRMSTLPSTAGGGMRTDPRPINDKAYMSSCVKKLTQYLLSAGYDQSVSARSLARPSGTEFSNIITFLLRKIDPTFNSGGSKFEDEVTQAFKRLGYPVNVSKTALAAVGSPHTWPALLSALTWLIELLNCDEATVPDEDWKNPRVQQQQLDIKEIEERGTKTFYKFIAESYSVFLLGNDDQVVYCEDKFIECFEIDTAIVAQKVEEITDWNAHLVVSIEQLRNTTNELPLLERKREEYCDDLEKFSDLINKLKEHKNASEGKVRDKTQELQKLEEELTQAEVKLETIRAKIASQGITVEDARRLQSEKARLEDGIAKAASTKQECNKTLWELEMELSRVSNELASVISRYNNKASDIPDLSERRNDMIIEINKNHAADTDQRLLLGGVDVSGVVRPHLDALKQSFSHLIIEKKQELSQCLNQEDAYEEALTEALDKVKILESMKIKVEENFARYSEDNDGALKVRLNEVEVLEKKNATLRDPIAFETAIARYQSRRVELEALHQQEKDGFKAKKEEVGAEIATALQACNEYINHISTQLKIVQEKLQIRREKFETIEDNGI